LRIDDDGLAFVRDDVGGTAEVLVQDLPEEHRGNDRPVRFDRSELAGAVADLGVLVPIAVTLIVANGLSPTAVLLPAAILYVANAAIYGLPLPAQPLKAFGAIAIAEGFGSDEIAAGAILLGALFLVAGRLGLLDLAARAFPRALIRGVQLTVGLLFLEIAWGLVTDPPKAFADYSLEPRWAVPLGVGAVVVAFVFRRSGSSLVLVATGIVVMLVLAGDEIALGPSAIELPSLDAAVFAAAFSALVVPQAPLSFANSCLAPADAARAYFGERAKGVRPGRLATTYGAVNIFAGGMSGMPVCHGAGGLTAHYSFGARTAGAPLVMGTSFLVLAVGAGAGLAALLGAFPLPILAGLLATAGLLHIGLLRDLAGVRDWVLALLVGAIGFQINLMWGLAAGLAAWWIPWGIGRLQARVASA
jgi:SulP family sulfate permease